MLRLRWFHFTVVPCDAPYEGFITGGSLLAAPLNEAKFILNTILQKAIHVSAFTYTNELSGDPVAGNEFLAVCKEIFPDATLSVGWTTGPEVSILNPN